MMSGYIALRVSVGVCERNFLGDKIDMLGGESEDCR